MKTHLRSASLQLSLKQELILRTLFLELGEKRCADVVDRHLSSDSSEDKPRPLIGAYIAIASSWVITVMHLLLSLWIG